MAAVDHQLSSWLSHKFTERHHLVTSSSDTVLTPHGVFFVASGLFHCCTAIITSAVIVIVRLAAELPSFQRSSVCANESLRSLDTDSVQGVRLPLQPHESLLTLGVRLWAAGLYYSQYL